MMTETRSTSFRFTKEFADLLSKSADELSISRTELIVRAVREYLSPDKECGTDSGTDKPERSDGVPQPNEWRDLYFHEREKRDEAEKQRNETDARNHAELMAAIKSLNNSQVLQGRELMSETLDISDTDISDTKAVTTDDLPKGRIPFGKRVKALFTGRM